jgi:hypothetical protein
VGSVAGSCVADYIPVGNTNEVIIYDAFLIDARCIVGYNKDKAVVAAWETHTNGTPLIIPNNVEYIRITGKAGVAPYVEITDASVANKAIGVVKNVESETIYKDELYRCGKEFPVKGVVQSDGVYVEHASSAYSMNKSIAVQHGESLTFVGYGTTSSAAIALYGDAQLTILWKTLPYPSGDETKPQSITFNNKTGRTIHAILSTKNSMKSYYYYGECDTAHIDFADIYHEGGVCVYSSKSYTQNSKSPYMTYFIPVKAGDKLFTKVGMYNSGFRIWACNGDKQYMDSPINKRGEQAYNDKSVLTELSVIVPIGVDYIGVTNRADEHTDIMIRRSEYYADDIPSREYRLSPQEGRIAFIIDGGYNKDAELKALFDAKGVKAGWALLYPWVNPNNYGMGVNYAQYLDWQAEGHEIDVHSGSAATYNNIDYTVPYQSEEQKKFAAMRHKEFSDIGFIPRAFVQLGSQHGGLPTEQSRKPIYYAFEFGFTRATNTITEKDKGAVMMPSDKPWNLGRSTLEVITLEQMKGLIDECAEKKGFLCIYAHSWRIGSVQYPNQTWDTFAEMIDYAKSKCKIDTPYNCVKALYANHIE